MRTEQKTVRRGWEGAVLKVLRGQDFTLTVQANDEVNPHYRRLRMADGGLLAACGVHPTMWIRLWFDREGRGHQRAYTLVDPDPTAGTFDLEFSLHEGLAADWARAAGPGDTIDTTVYGSEFAMPDPSPRRAWIVGDPASLPAVNSLLDALDGTPATLWLEYAHEAERDLPLRARAQDTVHWAARGADGSALIEAVRSGLDGAEPAQDMFWVAAEAASTRLLSRHLRREVGVDKERLHALGYWRAA